MPGTWRGGYEMLEIGLLWYDNGADDLSGSVARAAARYKERFGVDPNVCYVHPATLPAGECKINGLTVRPSSKILRYHLWMGVERRGGDEKIRA